MSRTNNLTYKDVTDYENVLIRFYHSYLTNNYLAELTSIALRHLPEDTSVEVLAELAADHQTAQEWAQNAARIWTEFYFDVQEGVPLADEVVKGIHHYEYVKQEMAANIGSVWLQISELFSTEQHDRILEELDDKLSRDPIEEQYDMVLTGAYPTMPEDVRVVIANLKERAINAHLVE